MATDVKDGLEREIRNIRLTVTSKPSFLPNMTLAAAIVSHFVDERYDEIRGNITDKMPSSTLYKNGVYVDVDIGPKHQCITFEPAIGMYVAPEIYAKEIQKMRDYLKKSGIELKEELNVFLGNSFP